MKTGLVTFLLIFAVSSSQAERKCIQKYVDCAVRLINKWQSPVSCSLPVPDLECFTNVFKECDRSQSSQKAFLESIAYLLREICHSQYDKNGERQNAIKCIGKNSDNFRTCSRNLPEDVCSAPRSILECTSSAMDEKCGKFGRDVTEKLMFPINVLDKECLQQAVALNIEYEKVISCVMNNGQRFLSCKLEKADDMCSSFNEFTQCLLNVSEETCGLQVKTTMVILMELGAGAANLCKGTGEPDCSKEMLTCTTDIFDKNQLQCSDASNYLGCLSDGTKRCQQEQPSLGFIALGKYKEKFPEYCNPESSFGKNILKHSTCIQENINNAATPCNAKLMKDLQDLVEQKQTDTIGMKRSFVNFLHCICNGIEEKCTKEAGDAVNDLVQPLADSLDESCRLQTGKRCNSACGLKAATWIFIASFTYLLTRRHA